MSNVLEADFRPKCPKCGCTARRVIMTAIIQCSLNNDMSLGTLRHVGKRTGTCAYLCSMGHKFKSKENINVEDRTD